MASSPSKVESRRASRHDNPVREKLAEAVRRIRFLEMTLGFCGLLVGLFAYAQIMAFLDVRFALPELLRQVALAGFLGLVGVWSYLFIYRPLRYGINLYYAAQVLEDSAPGSQNGLLNWLDLHEVPDAGHARGLIGRRAVKETERVNLEKAISGEPATRAAIAATLLFFFTFILALLLGVDNFRNSLRRVFLPYTFSTAPALATKITIVSPEGGDTRVLVGQSVTIRARFEGRIPDASAADAPRVRYRHGPEERWRERPMTALETSTRQVEIPSQEVQNGFYYQVTAGNATTETYRITVEAAPLLEEFRATYYFRQYTGRSFEVRRDRPLDSLEGTVVELRVKTNRQLAEGSPQLELDIPKVGRTMIPGILDKDDPTTFTVKLTLEKSGEYRLHFVSATTRRDTYVDPQKYPVVVRPDALPEVRLTVPGGDKQLPPDALLALEGEATDREGLAMLSLKLRVVGGPVLRPLVYREIESLRQKHRFYPTVVAYKDFLDLTKLRDEAGKVFTPQPKQEIEYWLEASDAFPDGPHTVASEHFRIKIIEPDPAAPGQGDKDREQAAKDKAEHAKKQDQAFAEEDAARKEENDRKEKGDRQGQGGDETQPGNQGEKNQGANNQPGNQGEKNPGEKNPDGKNPGEKNPGEQNPDDANTLNQAERIKNALDKEKNEQKQPPAGNQPGEGKDQGREQGAQKKENGDGAEKKEPASDKDQPGEGKDQGEKKPGANQPSERKEGGQQGMGENKPEGKDAGQPGMTGQNSGAGNPAEKKDAGQPGEGKEQKGQQGQGAEKPSQRKESGEQPGKDGAAQGKENGPDMQGQPGAERKDPAPQGNPPASERKEGGQPSDAPAQPNGKEQGSGTEKQPAEQKTPPDGQGRTQGATNKPGTNKRDPVNPQEARPEDVDALKNQAAEPSKERSDAAGKELERIEKEANDPKVREAAKQAREDLKKNAQPGGGESKKPGGDGMGQAEGGAEKKPGMAGATPGEAGGKPDAGMGPQAGKKAELKDPGPAGMGGMGGTPMKDENAPVAKGPGEMPAGGNVPGMGVERANTPEPGMGPGGNGPEVQAEKAAPAPATELQLRKFKEAVNSDILKELRMTQDEYERFLKKYADLANRPGGGAVEKLPPSQVGGGNLPALGTGQTKPGETGTGPTGPGVTTRPQAPAGYREAYREFLRQLAQPDR